jgi:hypothetical protein
VILTPDQLFRRLHRDKLAYGCKTNRLPPFQKSLPAWLVDVNLDRGKMNTGHNILVTATSGTGNCFNAPMESLENSQAETNQLRHYRIR